MLPDERVCLTVSHVSFACHVPDIIILGYLDMFSLIWATSWHLWPSHGSRKCDPDAPFFLLSVNLCASLSPF